MQNSNLLEMQEHVASFSDPAEQELAEAKFFGGLHALPIGQKHLVVLLHGMNTNAEWQEVLAESIRNDSDIEPLVVGYGNMHPIKFLIPSVFRRGRIKKVLTDLLGIRKRNPNADISVVAHSFGTYVIARILKLAPQVRFHRVLFCGGIVSTDYDWSLADKQFTSPVVNDVGLRDVWPSLAKSWSWGYGDSGVIGFQNSLARDRHFDYGHSDFLTVEHMREYWLPYLLDGQIVSSPDTMTRKKMKLWDKARRDLSWIHLIFIGSIIILWKNHWSLKEAGSAVYRFFFA